MKVLMISDMYPPSIGGMEREVKLLAEGLVNKKGCEVSVCTLGLEGMPDFEIKNGVRIYRFEGFFQKLSFIFSDSNQKFHPPVTDPLITRKLEQIVKKEKPDVIHAHNWMLYSVLPLRGKYDFLLCATFHDFGFVCPCRWSTLYPGGVCDEPLTQRCIFCGRETYGLPKSLFAYLGVRKYASIPCDLIIVSNPNLFDKMKHLKQRKIYLGHPIDAQIYKPMGIKMYRKRVLCWAKLQKIKGIKTTFEVARKLDSYEFDIPRIGEDMTYFGKIKPQNVNFISPIKSHEIPNTINSYPIVLGQFNIGVFGLAELEAMSCGKPVVAYWNRDYDRFYDEPCPILSSKNVDEIASLLELNINNPDPGLTSRNWILKYHDCSKVVGKLLKIYEAM